MRRKTIGVRLNKITMGAGEITQRAYSNTQDFVKGVSKEISGINWSRMYKRAQKNLRVSAKKGNKMYVRTIKKARKTGMYKVVSKQVPRYFTQFGLWSSVQLRKLKNFTSSRYNRSRRWIVKKSPRVKSLVKQYYPKVENFVLKQIPSYRLVFSK